jgi:hypothetical protein
MQRFEAKTSEAGNTIDKNGLDQLNAKLITAFDAQGRSSSFAEWATFAHFTLNTDVLVGRALANHLVQIIDTLKPAMPDAGHSDLLIALSSLAQFINLGLVKGIENAEAEMTVAWETFVSKVSYPKGDNHMGLDIDAGIQRWETAIAMSIIQEKIFGQVVDDYRDQS